MLITDGGTLPRQRVAPPATLRPAPAPAAAAPPTFPPASPRIRLLPQIALLVAAVTAYFGVRGATEGAYAEALHNARRIVDLERLLNLYHEPVLQEALVRAAPVTTVLNWIYIWGHWPVIAVTLLWLARRHPAVYLRTRDAMLLSGGIGMAVFVAFPVAPPRLADLGMVDTVSAGSEAYRVLQPTMFTNQYAAMPSLHVGWDLLVGLALGVAARHALLRALALAMPVAMVVAVVLTANHYIVDALAGAALTYACWTTLGRRGPAGGGRGPASGPAPLTSSRAAGKDRR